MKKPISRYVLWIKMVLLVFGILETSFALSAVTMDPGQVNWNLLKYSATKFMVSLQANVHYEVLNTGQAIQQLLPVPEGVTPKSMAENVHKMSLQTEVLGLHSVIKFWMNPDMTALQRTSLSTGRKFHYRSLRYHAQGVSSIRRQPANRAEEGLPYQKWSNISQSFYPLPKAEQALLLTEAEGLFYLLPASGISEPGEFRSALIYNRKGSLRLDLQVKDRVKLKVDFLKETNLGSQRVKRDIDTLRIRVNAHPIQDDGAKAEFSFLGYKEDIELYYDPERRIIVQISGKADYLGKVDIQLKEVGY